MTFLVATTDRGDVVALTNTAGAVFARYAYDPYGRVLTQTSNLVTGITSTVALQIRDRQPLRYAGYAYDAHSATYYLSARHYDPATMRFLTKDSARDDGEESAYQYCAGDPVGKVDPSGEFAQMVVALGRVSPQVLEALRKTAIAAGGLVSAFVAAQLLPTIRKALTINLKLDQKAIEKIWRDHRISEQTIREAMRRSNWSEAFVSVLKRKFLAVTTISPRSKSQLILMGYAPSRLKPLSFNVTTCFYAPRKYVDNIKRTDKFSLQIHPKIRFLPQYF